MDLAIETAVHPMQTTKTTTHYTYPHTIGATSMKTNRLAVICAIVSAYVFGFQPAKAQDPVKVAAYIYKVIFESDKVRVLDVVCKPGEKAAMHMHPYHVAYGITDSKFKFTLADGKTIIVEGKAGQVMEGPPGLHSPENIGTSDAHVIVFEVKAPPKKMKK